MNWVGEGAHLASDIRTSAAIPETKGRGRLAFLAGAALLAAPVTMAVAQGSTPAPAVVDEVVVTAQLRAESLKDVPISITAVGGEQLDASSFTGVAEVLRTVPGVATLGNRNGIGSQIVIRGIPSGFFFSGASTIAYYLDSTPMGLVRSSLGPDAGIYDLQRIEVLRGPQGTLYGASAQAGVVRVLTDDPELDDFEFKARGMTSATEHGGMNYRGDVAMNLPVIEDKLAARIVVGLQDYGGWIDRPGDRNANDSEVTNLRFKVRARPVEKLTLDAALWIVRSDFGAPSTGDGHRRHASTFPEPSHADYETYTGKITYDFGFATLTSATSLLDFRAANILDYRPFGFAALQDTTFDSEVFVQDVAIASTGSGPWKWSAGLFYRDAKDRTIQTFPPVTIPTGFADTSESTAVFGEVTRVFADGQFEVTGGLRYFEDKVTTRDLAPTGTFADKAKFDAWSPRGVLTWRPSDDAMLYASYSKGFRSGSLQTPGPGALGFRAALPEDVHNYEVGTKAALFNRFLDVDASVYYMERRDIQQSLSVPVVVGGLTTFRAAFVNGPGASGMGVDFSMVLHPTSAVNVGVNGSVNDLEFDENVITGAALLARKGGRISDSPRTTLGVSGDVTFPLAGDAEAVLSGSLNYRSKVTTNTTVGPLESDDILVGNVNLAVRAAEHWRVSVFIDNITDESGVASKDQFRVPSWDLRTRPRTFGVQLEYEY